MPRKPVLLREVQTTYRPRTHRPTRQTLGTPETVADYVRPLLQGQPLEHLYAVLLDQSRSVVGVIEVGSGTSTEVMADPKVLVRAIAATNASGVILAHNHPSGSLTISKDDRQMTQRVAAICELLAVTMVDHLVLPSNGQEFLAFSEQADLKDDLITFLILNDGKLRSGKSCLWDITDDRREAGPGKPR